jgi:hypothetical protein
MVVLWYHLRNARIASLTAPKELSTVSATAVIAIFSLGLAQDDKHVEDVYLLILLLP